MQISLIFKVEIDLLWTAAIAELRFIKSLMRTEMTEITEIVEATVMVLAFKKWLLEAVAVLGLTDTVLAAAIIWS